MLDSFPALAVFIVIWLGVLGLVIGSFLNVVIARLPAGQSIVHPRSKCPRCDHQLSWYENIPVVSYVFLRGKCRGCSLPISIRYPLIELLTCALFLGCIVRFGFDYSLALGLMLVTLLVPLTFIDAEHWILPHELTLPGIGLGVLISIPLGTGRVVDALLGAAMGFIVFRAIEIWGFIAFRKEALGGGDKFLFALLGAFLTHRCLLGILFLASIQGAIFGIGRLLVTGRAGPAPQAHAEGESQGEPESFLKPTITWEFLKPTLSFPQRVLAFFYAVFLQPIPDDPPTDEGAEPAWTPGISNLPFGPWLALAGLEVMFFSKALVQWLAIPGIEYLVGAGQ